MVEIDLKALLLILRKRLWIIILITVLCTGISGYVSYYILKPVYQTYTTLMIGRPQEYKLGMDYDDVMLNQKLVSTYGEIAKSRIVANEFMSNLGLSYTQEELEKKIKVTLVKDTEIIKISVKDRDSNAAARIANEIASVFIKNVSQIMNIENIQVIDKAEIPLKPDNPKPLLNMLIASILGIMTSVISILVHELLDDTIRSAEDIERILGLPIIGIVPRMT